MSLPPKFQQPTVTYEYVVGQSRPGSLSLLIDWARANSVPFGPGCTITVVAFNRMFDAVYPIGGNATAINTEQLYSVVDWMKATGHSESSVRKYIKFHGIQPGDISDRQGREKRYYGSTVQEFINEKGKKL